jgi:hypothetical protein
MSRPSVALRELESAIAVLPADQPVTWGQLQEKLAEAAHSAEYSEWEDSMGDDL